MSDTFSTGEQASKLDVAKNSILTLLNKLNERDRFGLVLFDTVLFFNRSVNLQRTEVLCPLSDWKSIDIAKLKENLMKVKTRGGTDIGIGKNHFPQ